MAKARDLWVLLADSEHARLLHATLTAHGRMHVDELAKLETTFAAGEHHRPTRMSRPGRSSPLGHEHEEKLSHFAREVARWLEQEIAARTIGACMVFAPSHFLGALRKEVPKALANKLVEQTGELTGLTLAQLAEHPGITGQFGV